MIDWATRTLIACTLLMLTIALARPLLRPRVSPRLIYALWALPALRMIVPPLPLLEADAVPMTTGTIAGPIISHGLQMATVVMSLWLAGAALSFTWHFGRYRRFVRAARADSVGAAATIGRVRILHCSLVDGPVAAGLWRRQIFLPLDFKTRFEAQERRLALAHELMHHRRSDLLANFVAIAVLSLHWFNPIAYYAHRLFRADQELACDADVLRYVGQGRRAAYGRILLKASRGTPAALCGLSEVALLKQRLRGLATSSPTPAPAVAALAMSAAYIVVALSAATSRATEHFAPMPQTLLDRGAVSLPVSEASTTATAPELVAAPRSIAATTKAPTKARIRSLRRAEPQQSARANLERRWDHASPAEIAAARGRPVNDPVYLARRRALGQARARMRYGSAAEAAAARGRPLIEPPPTG